MSSANERDGEKAAVVKQAAELEAERARIAAELAELEEEERMEAEVAKTTTEKDAKEEHNGSLSFKTIFFNFYHHFMIKMISLMIKIH